MYEGWIWTLKGIARGIQARLVVVLKQLIGPTPWPHYVKQVSEHRLILAGRT
jgi:hypothetical protein